MSFLGEMQTVVTAQCLSVTRYNIEDRNAKGGAMWVQKTASENKEDILGMELIKIKCDYEMFEQLKSRIAEGELTCPGTWEVLVEIEVASGNKAALRALSVKPHKEMKPNLPNKAA